MDMTKFGHADDPGFSAIAGELRRWAKALCMPSNAEVVEVDTVQQRQEELQQNAKWLQVRERRKMPFLTEVKWLQAVAKLGIIFTLVKDTKNISHKRSGRYMETWMNLLNIFGAESIIYSEFVEQRPIPDNLPSGIENPFAVDLALAACFAGLTGCTILKFEGGVPQFEGDSCSLHFTQNGESEMIGEYTQGLRVAAYFNYGARDVVRPCILNDEYFLYQERKLAPMYTREYQGVNAGGTESILKDLNQHRCDCDLSFGPLAIGNSSLASAALGLLAADSLDSIRMFPANRCCVLEAACAISSHCSLWTSPSHDDQESRFFRRTK